MLGFNLKDIAMAGVAVIAAPFVERQVMSILPVSITGTKMGRWGVKIGSAVLIGYGAKKFLGPKAGNLALIALGANIIADAVAEFAPTFTLGYYPNVRASGSRALGANMRGYVTSGQNPAMPNSYAGVYPGLSEPVNSDPFRSPF